MQLQCKNIDIHHAGRPILSDISFTLPSGSLGCLLGPSGCGKTSLLRAIAGFHELSRGEIILGEGVISRPGMTLDPSQRGVGMVFQDLALLPHLSVAGNVGFGLHDRPRAEVQQRTQQMLDLTGLRGLGERYPHQLSGGQQQRVALARALAPQPAMLLLDEPFSSLDSSLRPVLARQVRDIVSQTKTTALLVTHDQHEAFAMSQHVGVLGGGVLHQWSSAYDIYHRPANQFVAEFVGDGVWLKGQLDAAGRVHTAIGELPAVCPLPPSQGEVMVLLRPDDIQHDDHSPLKARIVDASFRGANILFELEIADGQRLKTLTPSHHNHQVGQDLGIRVAMDHVIAFPA
nr:ABC transporter ATP-binding protein [Oceanococcus sp. HetDA_MAG_MS8]